MTTTAQRLTRAQRDALNLIYTMGDPDLRTLRANGFRKDVINRLCAAKLAFWVDQFGGERIRVQLTSEGVAWAEVEQLRAERDALRAERQIAEGLSVLLGDASDRLTESRAEIARLRAAKQEESTQ